MNNQLQIPLQTTARHHIWRAVWLLLILIVTCIISFSLFRVWTMRDTTSMLIPNDAKQGLRFIKSAGNTELLDRALGPKTLLPGAPWTYHDALVWSRREFTLYISENGNHSVVFDQVLPDQIVFLANNYGYQAISDIKGRSIITKNVNNLDDPRTKYTFFSASPWFDGTYIYQAEKIARTGISLKENGIIINKLGQAFNYSTNWIINEDSNILASLSIPADALQNPIYLEYLAQLPENQQLIDTIRKQGAHLVLATDSKGTAFYLAIPNANITTDELAVIGEDILSRDTLTTTALTMPDGSFVKEIRTANKNITSSVETNEGYTIISLKNSAGNVIRIAQTQEKITLSNREFSTEINPYPITSTCSIKAHSFIRMQELYLLSIESSEQLATNQFLTGFPLMFTEIALNNNKTRLCW
ncbi:MAG: hypothetical protein ABH846_04240 [Patescibacteria group bacterium]